jgi:carboxymethylenebutenolidase
MCDDHTEHDADASLGAMGFSRRQFTAMGAATLAAALAASEAEAKAARLVERMVTIDTLAGRADAFFVHPARGKYPAVIMWPDIAGLRDAWRPMATRCWWSTSITAMPAPRCCPASPSGVPLRAAPSWRR